MSAIHDRQITHPAAWTSAEIGGREGLTHRITPAHASAMWALVDKTRHLAPDAVTRVDFEDPLVADLMKAVRFEVMAGKGAIVLSGLDLSGRSEEDFARLYWGLGTHLGQGAIQSPKRDRIGRVEKLEHNPDGRGYQLDIELRSHSDFHELLSLACVRKAAEGGESGIVSTLAIHNILQREAPHHLKALYEGFFHGYAGQETLTKEKVPIFCDVDGTVSCFFHGLFWINAARQMGVSLPDDFREAIAAFSEAAHRPEVRADFMLEPGEMLFWHNFTMLHSRAAFTDTQGHKRLLLRLWIHVQDGRPMHPEFVQRAHIMDALHAQGRTALNYAQVGVGDVSAEKVLEATR